MHIAPGSSTIFEARPARPEATRPPPADRSRCTDRRRDAGPVECEEGAVRYNRFLELQNEEHRAAIEAERLLAQLMAWRAAPVLEEPGEDPLFVPVIDRECPPDEDWPAARRDVPRLAETSPVVTVTLERRVRLMDRIREFVFSGELIDVFA